MMLSLFTDAFHLIKGSFPALVAIGYFLHKKLTHFFLSSSLDVFIFIAAVFNGIFPCISSEWLLLYSFDFGTQFVSHHVSEFSHYL